MLPLCLSQTCSGDSVSTLHRIARARTEAGRGADHEVQDESRTASVPDAEVRPVLRH